MPPPCPSPPSARPCFQLHSHRQACECATTGVAHLAGQLRQQVTLIPVGCVASSGAAGLARPPALVSVGQLHAASQVRLASGCHAVCGQGVVGRQLDNMFVGAGSSALQKYLPFSNHTIHNLAAQTCPPQAPNSHTSSAQQNLDAGSKEPCVPLARYRPTGQQACPSSPQSVGSGCSCVHLLNSWRCSSAGLRFQPPTGWHLYLQVRCWVIRQASTIQWLRALGKSGSWGSGCREASPQHPSKARWPPNAAGKAAACRALK